MKRFSQTLKVMLALFVAIFSNGLLPTTAAYALQPSTTENTVETESSDTASNSKETTSKEQADENTPEIVSVAKLASPQQQSFYNPPACEASDVYVVSKNTDLTMVTVKLTIAAALQHKTCIVSLNSYETEGPTWQTSGDQVFIDHDQVTLTIQNPQSSLKVKSPKCYGQTDLYIGSTKYDGKDGPLPHYPQPIVPANLIAHWNGGQKCEPPKKVTICHRTASAVNPYVRITVDESSVDGNTGNDNGQGDHYAEHTGPIFPQTGSDGKWGDIIPPVAGHNGLNWTPEGQEILDNDCNIPVEISVTPGACAYYDTKSELSINVTGTAKDSTLIVYDSSNNIVYSAPIEVDKDGNVTSPTFPVKVSGLTAGDYTVKILTKGGHEVLASKTVTIEQCYYTTKPVKPIKLDYCYNDQDGIFIPTVNGVIYTVNDTEMSGFIPFTGTKLIIKATPATGWKFEDGAKTKWVYTNKNFSNESCIVITKSAKYLEDTNKDGMASEGDLVKWTVTVTNNGSTKLNETFTVVVEDSGATFTDNGKDTYTIDSLEVGKPVTLEVSKPLTVSDLQVCKATNKASFTAWRTIMQYNERSLSSAVVDDGEAVFTGTTDTVDFNFDCPTPGSGNGGMPETPATLPATGPADGSNPLLVLAAAAIAYGATYFIQRRRELASN